MSRLFRPLVLIVLLAACSEPLSAPAPEPTARLVRRTLANSELPDPYPVAAIYVSSEVVAALPVALSQFASDAEAVSDAEFDSLGVELMDATEEVVYEDDGLFVEWAVGAGGGDPEEPGGDPEMMTITFEFASAGGDLEACESMYKRLVNRCKRIFSRKGRAVCYGVAMAAYAICRADAQ